MAEGRSGEQSSSEKRDEQGGGLGWCETHQAHHLRSDTRIVPADVDGVPVHATETVTHGPDRFDQTLAEVRRLLDPANQDQLDAVLRESPSTAAKLLQAAGQVILAELARRPQTGGTVMVGGGFMLVDEEVAIAPYERVGGDETSDWVQRVMADLKGEGLLDMGPNFWESVAEGPPLTNRVFTLDRPEHVCTEDCPAPWGQAQARGIGEVIRALLHDGIPRGASTIAAELGVTPDGRPGYAYESVMRACRNMVSDGRLVATPTEGENEHMLTLPVEG